ncbi:MAG: FAD-binding and (Fe-S)-binding domain-containing protein [Roseovarius confluentis]|jgi:FAD/FMN-containing dehydrogenase/Fe-S oxidoreductase
MTQHDKSLSQDTLPQALRRAGFAGEIENDTALLSAMSTDNSIYQIRPDIVVAPHDSADCAVIASVLSQPQFASVAVTPRGGGTGTNGQSLNRGLIIDTRRHMHRLLDVNVEEGWAEVEPGLVLDDLNEQLRPSGLFFAPETSTSTRCTIGGMVSTDASGKGSRVYGKTSDNILALQIARPEGLLSSNEKPPEWAAPMLHRAEQAARGGRDAFMANTPRLNRRFTGYDLERACPPGGGFEWWRLFLGAEGTLGLITRIRVKLRRIESEKQLLVVGFDGFRNALSSTNPLLAAEPTAIEVMNETVQKIASDSGLLDGLPAALRAVPGREIAYTFIEFNGNDPAAIAARIAHCREILAELPGADEIYQARDRSEIQRLWAIRSGSVGLLGKVDGPARPVAFVEDCVVPPENLPAFVDDFRALLTSNGLSFGIYGHADVGCLHFRPTLNIDSEDDRDRLVAISDAVFDLTRKYGGIFWGEHGKGVRGAYLRPWIGEEAYSALQGVKQAFDPEGRFNPGKLTGNGEAIMGIATTPFRQFNAPEGDPLERAFRCNGNAQCLSYAHSTPMCPSFKATSDLRQSPKGRADALREWHSLRAAGHTDDQLEADLLDTLDGCLGCNACESSCPVQVDIPTMRTTFYEDYFSRHTRPFADRLTLLAERMSRQFKAVSPFVSPVWPLLAGIGQRLTGTQDLPRRLAGQAAPSLRLSDKDLASTSLPDDTVLLVQDWFTALFDAQAIKDIAEGLRALGYRPRLLEMRPAGKAALTMGDRKGFEKMAQALSQQLSRAAETGAPLVGLDPAFVMMLRQDYPKAGFAVPEVLLVQEFLVQEIEAGKTFPSVRGGTPLRLLSHCTEATSVQKSGAMWTRICQTIGIEAETPATGCCGMAGLFGHQSRHQGVSRALFDLSWRTQVETDQPVAATGFSCRCQASRFSGHNLRHPMGLIAEGLRQ